MLGASADVELAMAELLSPFVPAPIRSDFLLIFHLLSRAWSRDCMWLGKLSAAVKAQGKASFPHRNHDENKRTRNAVGSEGGLVGRGGL